MVQATGQAEASLARIEQQLAATASGGQEAAEASSRDLAMAMSRATIAVLLLEHASRAAGAAGARAAACAAALATEWCWEMLPLGGGGGLDGAEEGCSRRLARARLIAQVDLPLSQPRCRY